MFRIPCTMMKYAFPARLINREPPLLRVGKITRRKKHHPHSDKPPHDS